MTTGGYAMLIVSWSVLLVLSGWCLRLLLKAEGQPSADPGDEE